MSSPAPNKATTRATWKINLVVIWSDREKLVNACDRFIINPSPNAELLTRFESKENVMRKPRFTLLPAFFIATLLLALPLIGVAQNREKFVISARAGGVNTVTGRASMRPHGNSEWRQLTIKEDLETGDVVKTGVDGRVEVLLNPGSYMRIAENSEVELTDNSLENLELRLTRGTAIVEATGTEDQEMFIGITTPHTRLSIVQRGLYRLNVIPGDTTELIVRKGRVMLEDSHTKVKGGSKVVFSSGSFSVAKLTDADKKNWDTFETWSKERGQTLAKANSKISGKTMTAFAASFRNDWGFMSGRPFWFYNATIGCFTLVPFGYGWNSPYGGSYSRFFYGPYDRGYWGGHGHFGIGPVFTGITGGRSSGSGSGTSGSPSSNPGASGRGVVNDSPMTRSGKPDISPGGDGPRPSLPNRE